MEKQTSIDGPRQVVKVMGDDQDLLRVDLIGHRRKDFRFADAQNDLGHCWIVHSFEHCGMCSTLVEQRQPGLGCKRRVNGDDLRRRGRRAGITGSEKYLSENRDYAWMNKNKLLTRYYDPANGGKTGGGCGCN